MLVESIIENSFINDLYNTIIHKTTYLYTQEVSRRTVLKRACMIPLFLER